MDPLRLRSVSHSMLPDQFSERMPPVDHKPDAAFC
jgi:hypothetical protein